MRTPALSVGHFRDTFEKTAGPAIKLVQSLGASEPAKLAEFRREFESIVSGYYAENLMHQDYLLTRANKI